MMKEQKELSNTELLQELQKNKNDNNKARIIIDEIEKRYNNQSFSFDSKQKDKLYLLLLMCNRLEKIDFLNSLINDDNFIKNIDKTDISGSMLISLSNIASKPRQKLLENSSKIKKSLLDEDDLFDVQSILDDLTLEEISLLRENLEIDNYLITNGISFNTLKEETRNAFRTNLNLLSLYSLEAINAFYESEKNHQRLANNSELINIYLNKLDDNYYHKNPVISDWTEETITKVITSNPADHIIFQLINNTTGSIQKLVLSYPKSQKLINETHDKQILESIPSSDLSTILMTKTNRLHGLYLELIKELPSKELNLLMKNGLFTEILNSPNLDNLDISFFFNKMNKSEKAQFLDAHLIQLSINNLLKLSEDSPNSIKNAVLHNPEYCIKLLNEDMSKIETTIQNCQFNSNELLTLLTYTKNLINNPSWLSLFQKLDEKSKCELYKDQEIVLKLLRNDKFTINSENIDFLMTHPEYLKELKPSTYYDFISSLNDKQLSQVLSNKESIKLLFKYSSTNTSKLPELLKKNPNIINFITNTEYIPFYNKEIFQTILDSLNFNAKEKMCTNELLEHILSNNLDLINLYQKLKSRNRFILNTIYFPFFTEGLLNLKLSDTEDILKNKDIQIYLYTISKSYELDATTINTIKPILSQLEVSTITKILQTIALSAKGINRKRLGNIPKMLKESNTNQLSSNDWQKLITYVLYLIKDDEPISALNILDTPKALEDILNYEVRVENQLSTLIPVDPESAFIGRHYKLTLPEAQELINKFSINKIDSSIYPKEYSFLENLRKVLHTKETNLMKMEQDYPIYSLYDIYTTEKKLKEMYAKIYNYEMRSRSYQNKSYTINLYGKEVRISDINNEFLFLKVTTPIINELKRTNNYFEAWHNTLNELKYLNTTLVANDHISPFDDFFFCLSGLHENALISIKNGHETFRTPRELIDETRMNNEIILDKMAVRSNNINGNIPNIEPDFILINKKYLSDHTYMEQVIRASEDFKSKIHKNGLPIVAIDFEHLITSEQEKINKGLSRYNKTHDMNIISSILTKVSNNYSSYINTIYENNFNVQGIIDIISERVKKSNSASELKYLKEVIIKEKNKQILKTFNDEEIMQNIKKRLQELSNQ